MDLLQQYHCDRWDKRLRIWGSVAEKGSTFSPACRRLAIVLHVHFLSKVTSLENDVLACASEIVCRTCKTATQGSSMPTAAMWIFAMAP